jgi:hypothetical protein
MTNPTIDVPNMDKRGVIENTGELKHVLKLV